MLIMICVLAATNVALVLLWIVERKENHRQVMELVKLIKAQSLTEFNNKETSSHGKRNWLFPKINAAYGREDYGDETEDGN